MTSHAHLGIHVLAVLLATVSQPAMADLVQPPGLQPGDKYHLAFVTSGTRDGASGNINDYNAFVQAQAELPGAITENYGIQWKAIASTLTVHARDNALVQAPVYLLNVTKIADSFADMWDGALDSPHNFNVDQFGNVHDPTPDEFGNVPHGSFVWTGTWTDGASFATPSFPGDRYLGASEFAIRAVTIPPFPYGQWIASSSQPVTDLYSLYALSELITVSAVPEASQALCLICALSMGAIWWTARQKCRKQALTPG